MLVAPFITVKTNKNRKSVRIVKIFVVFATISADRQDGSELNIEVCNVVGTRAERERVRKEVGCRL